MPISSTLISNLRSERIKKVHDLLNHGAQKKTGKFLVEGPQNIREALKYAPEVILDIFFDSHSQIAHHIIESSEDSECNDENRQKRESIYIHPCTREVIQKMSLDAQGIVAVCSIEKWRQWNDGEFHNRENLLSEQSLDFLAAACWQIRDPGNAGAFIRTADASGCSVFIFVGECVSLFSPKVIRSTAGSLFHIPVISLGEEDFFEWIKKKKHNLGEDKCGLWAADIHSPVNKPRIDMSDIYKYRAKNDDTDSDYVKSNNAGNNSSYNSDCAEKNIYEKSHKLYSFLTHPLIILFGNEARGLPLELRERTDGSIFLPIYGKAESYNLAMSGAGILCTLAMARRNL